MRSLRTWLPVILVALGAGLFANPAYAANISDHAAVVESFTQTVDDLYGTKVLYESYIDGAEADSEDSTHALLICDTESLTTRTVTSDGSEGRMWGNWVAFNRRGTLYAKNLTSGKSIRIASDMKAWGPQAAIWGNTVVYRDTSREAAGDIVVYDLAKRTRRRITGAGMQGWPSIWGSMIAFVSNAKTDANEWDRSSEVFLYDMTTGRTTRLTNNPVADFSPHVGDGFVAYQRTIKTSWVYNQDIYVYDIASKATTRRSNEMGYETIQDVWGSRLMYADSTDTWIYDHAGDASWRMGPARAGSLHGSLVAWTDSRNEASLGEGAGTDHNRDVYYGRFSTMFINASLVARPHAGKTATISAVLTRFNGEPYRVGLRYKLQQSSDRVHWKDVGLFSNTDGTVTCKSQTVNVTAYFRVVFTGDVSRLPSVSNIVKVVPIR